MRLARETNSLRGRQIAKSIFQRNEPEAATVIADATRTVQGLSARSCEHVESYLSSLDAIIETCPESLPEALLEANLVAQMEKSSEFNLDVVEYERGSLEGRHNYVFLRRRCDEYLERVRRKRIDRELENAYKGISPSAPFKKSFLGNPASVGAQSGKEHGSKKADSDNMKKAENIK